MYGLFFPENNQRVLPDREWADLEECKVDFRQRHPSWQELVTRHDPGAFMNMKTGHIVVIREIVKVEEIE